MRIQVYDCDQTVLMVFEAGETVLFRVRLTRAGLTDLHQRLGKFVNVQARDE